MAGGRELGNANRRGFLLRQTSAFWGTPRWAEGARAVLRIWLLELISVRYGFKKLKKLYPFSDIRIMVDGKTQRLYGDMQFELSQKIITNCISIIHGGSTYIL